MTSSLKRRSLSKPKHGVKIDLFDLGVVRTRNKNKVHSLLLEIFNESDLSKADLAKMLGRKPEQITRWLAGPGNITLDTVSDLIFAINGEHFAIECKNDISRGKSNQQAPGWLLDGIEESNWKIVPVPDRAVIREKSSSPHSIYSSQHSSVSSQKEKKYERFESPAGKTKATIPGL